MQDKSFLIPAPVDDILADVTTLVVTNINICTAVV